MIVTLTLNPAVDQTIFLERLDLGTVDRFHESQLDPAGKGINVSRMAERLGWPTIAFGFLAGEIGDIIQRALGDEGVQHQFVRVPGQTRLNVTIVDLSRGISTSLWGPGPAVGQKDLAELDGLVHFWLQACPVLVLAGSLPPGVPNDAYVEYIRDAKARGAKVILDADGEAFRLGIEAGPHLVKPNVREAEELLGRPLPDTPAVVEGARELVRRGIETVVVSMGSLGAVCVQRDRAWWVIPPKVELRSTVGSGDSMVAGMAIALARGDDILDGLRVGAAAGAATAMTPGTALGTSDDVASLLPKVVVKEM